MCMLVLMELLVSVVIDHVLFALMRQIAVRQMVFVFDLLMQALKQV